MKTWSSAFDSPQHQVTLAILAWANCVAWSHCLVAEEPEVTVNSIGMKLVKVPAGEFMMGAEEEPSQTLTAFPYCQPVWLDGELPRHKVRITRPFLMGQTEVKLNQFLMFYHETKYQLDMEKDREPQWAYSVDGQLIQSKTVRPWAPGWKLDQSHPVVYVSWNDAVAWCEWMSKKEGKHYRLPTEAEWEYACRAGSESRFSWGNKVEEAVRYGNVADQDGRVGFEKATVAVYKSKDTKEDTRIPFPHLAARDGFKWTAPVGKYRPNAYGLYDMHGNVWEWCSDWYDVKYYGNSPADDPQGPSAGSARVLRGGAFGDTPVNLRCAYRNFAEPAYRYFYYGFRVVCEL
ncbi:MAG TPA: formylglycine-generating enzyme family protein [Pirellulaceae bacterium]